MVHTVHVQWGGFWQSQEAHLNHSHQGQLQNRKDGHSSTKSIGFTHMVQSITLHVTHIYAGFQPQPLSYTVIDIWKSVSHNSELNIENPWPLEGQKDSITNSKQPALINSIILSSSCGWHVSKKLLHIDNTYRYYSRNWWTQAYPTGVLCCYWCRRVNPGIKEKLDSFRNIRISIGQQSV